MGGSRDRHPEEERKEMGIFPREAGGRKFSVLQSKGERVVYLEVVPGQALRDKQRR